MRRSRGAFPLAPGLVLVLLVGAIACATGVAPEELPPDPIAISYRSPDEARRRAEDYLDEHQGDSKSGPTAARQPRQGYADLVASEDNMSEILDRLFGRGSEDKKRYLGRLALLDPRSNEVHVVVAARRGSIPLAWSPDRERLLFAQPLDADFQIYEYTRSDETVRAVTHGPPAHTQACYGPEGRIVAAVVDTRAEPVRSYLAVSGPGGRSPYRRLTDGPADHSPACQPGGTSVVFVRETGPSSSDLLVVDLAPGGESAGPSPGRAGGPQRRSPGRADGPRRLSPGRHPSFSADGEWVAFAAPFKKELRIWRIRPDGTGRAPIGRGVRHEARPSISPDGRLVTYVAAEEAPRRHLYLRRFDGSGDRILFTSGDGEYPVW